MIIPTGIVLALLSSVLFGASKPLTKLLLTPARDAMTEAEARTLLRDWPGVSELEVWIASSRWQA